MTLTASTKPSGERASTRNRGLTTFAPCPCREFTQKLLHSGNNADSNPPLQPELHTTVHIAVPPAVRDLPDVPAIQAVRTACDATNHRLPPPVLVNPADGENGDAPFECGINYRHAQKITPGSASGSSPFSPYRCGCTLLGLPGR